MIFRRVLLTFLEYRFICIWTTTARRIDMEFMAIMQAHLQFKQANYYLVKFHRKQDGQEMELDLTPLIETREVFWRLKNFRYFRHVKIDLLGGLYWSEGEDISPTKIFHYAK
jgi:hypothetical protein